jgi:hypothetical protein
MATIEIQDGVLTTERFGDKVQIRVPKGGSVELCTYEAHTDVELREPSGRVMRRFRLPRTPHADG